MIHDEAERIAVQHVRWWRTRSGAPGRSSRFAATLCAAEIGAHATTWDDCIAAYACAWIAAGEPCQGRFAA